MAEGANKILSVCEVQVTPQGPRVKGVDEITVASPFDLTISGVGFKDYDRVRWVGGTGVYEQTFEGGFAKI